MTEAAASTLIILVEREEFRQGKPGESVPVMLYSNEARRASLLQSLSPVISCHHMDIFFNEAFASLKKSHDGRMATIDVNTEIQKIFETNKLEDLKGFIKKRNCLNSWNIALIYLFHIIQSAGILTTTIAAGYDVKAIVWVGVGLNILASLITVFEKTNNAISPEATTTTETSTTTACENIKTGNKSSTSTHTLD
jgi:hypothetical protein